MNDKSEISQSAALALSKANQSGALVEVEQQRAIAETQAAMVVAKRFPRDHIAAMDRIKNTCTRVALAEAALYQYARGGSDITGPSIRLAEAIAQNWGNIQIGIREDDQKDGNSTVEAFAWDIETNVRQVKIFQVPHKRFTRKGTYNLEDPRDIYETVANQGARRLRPCILGVIPGDVVEMAVKQCDKTLKTSVQVTPEVIQKVKEQFAKYQITVAQIEKRIQRRIDSITPAQLVNLGKVYNSLEDGMSNVSDWFEPESTPTSNLKDAAETALNKVDESAEEPEKVVQPEVAGEPEKQPDPEPEQEKGPAAAQPTEDQRQEAIQELVKTAMAIWTVNDQARVVTRLNGVALNNYRVKIIDDLSYADAKAINQQIVDGSLKLAA